MPTESAGEAGLGSAIGHQGGESPCGPHLRSRPIDEPGPSMSRGRTDYYRAFSQTAAFLSVSSGRGIAAAGQSARPQTALRAPAVATSAWETTRPWGGGKAEWSKQVGEKRGREGGEGRGGRRASERARKQARRNLLVCLHVGRICWSVCMLVCLFVCLSVRVCEFVHRVRVMIVPDHRRRDAGRPQRPEQPLARCPAAPQRFHCQQ